MKIYHQSMTVDRWYGNAVRVPKLGTPKFRNFALSCIGLASSVYSAKHSAVDIATSNSIPTAYADRANNRIVLSTKFLAGDFSALGMTESLSAKITLGAIMGVLVHELGHFAYSPDTLLPQVEYIEQHTTREFNRGFARNIANIVEDIYIERMIANVLPTLAWTLESINKLMLSESKYTNAHKILSSVHSITSEKTRVDITNYLLFAKVTNRAGKVSPFVRDIFNLAVSSKDCHTLDQRCALSLTIYDALMIDISQPEQPEQPENQPEQPESSNLDDSQPEHSESQNNDSEQGTEQPEQNDQTTVDTGDDDSDDDDDDDLDDDESDDSYTSGNQPENDDSDSVETILIADDSTEQHIPSWDIQSVRASDTEYGASGITYRKIDLGLASALVLETRYSKLVEIARQRASVFKPLGIARNSGRNIRQLERIITDGKIFAERSPSNSFQPIDVMIVVDCSWSMHSKSKINNALQSAYGCALALVTARCNVSVYGHTSNGEVCYGDTAIIKFLDRGESLNTMAQRMSYLLENQFAVMDNNRDGYALEYLAKKLPQSNRQRLMLVISDGMPNANKPTYKSNKALIHTREVVDKIRASGIHVQSLSIDKQAFAPNNYIYGAQHNVCSTESDALDQLVKQILER